MTRLDQDVLIAGRFRLTRELGRGGMGSVWLAHHVALDVPCAVKFIAEASASDAVFRNRFEREARAVARLRHPNVVQVYDTGVWEDLPYIAMELLEGEALGERMARLGKLDLGATAAIVTQVAAALQRAAQLGIVHRDLKPENIFLARQGAGETVKLLDFGIAKLHHEADRGPVTVTGAFVGTPQYMSPEHAHGGKEIDPRSDLWSLAVVTYECVTGRLPFDGTGLGEVLQAIMSAPIPVPSAIEPALQGAFDGWWARAAAREPAERFQTAADLAAALELVARVPAGAPAGGAVQRAGADTVQAAAADTVQAAAAARATEPAATLSGAERAIAASRSRSPAAIAGRVGVAALLVAAAWLGLRAVTPWREDHLAAGSAGPDASDASDASGAFSAPSTAPPSVPPSPPPAALPPPSVALQETAAAAAARAPGPRAPVRTRAANAAPPDGAAPLEPGY